MQLIFDLIASDHRYFDHRIRVTANTVDFNRRYFLVIHLDWCHRPLQFFTCFAADQIDKQSELLSPIRGVRFAMPGSPITIATTSRRDCDILHAIIIEVTQHRSAFDLKLHRVD